MTYQRNDTLTPLAEDFTEAKALTIIGHTVAAMIGGKQ